MVIVNKGDREVEARKMVGGQNDENLVDQAGGRKVVVQVRMTDGIWVMVGRAMAGIIVVEIAKRKLVKEWHGRKAL